MPRNPTYIYTREKEKEREREGDWFLVSNWQGRSNRPLPVHYECAHRFVSCHPSPSASPPPSSQFRSKPHVWYLARKYSFAVLNSVRYYRLGPDVRRPIESRHLEMQRTDVIWKETWRERKISRCLEWINRFRNYQFHSWKVNIGKIVLFVSLSTIINFYALERWECLFFKNFFLFPSLLQSYEVSWNNNRRIGGFSQFVNTFLPSSTSLLFSSLLMLIIL